MRRVLQERTDFQEVVENLIRAKRNQGRATWRSDGAGFSDAPSHESFGVDLVRSLGNHEKTRNNDAPHEGRGSTVRSLAQRRLAL